MLQVVPSSPRPVSMHTPTAPTPYVQRKRKSKTQTNVRLSDEVRRLLSNIADYRGISMSDTVEQLVKEEARRLGILDDLARYRPPKK